MKKNIHIVMYVTFSSNNH